MTALLLTTAMLAGGPIGYSDAEPIISTIDRRSRVVAPYRARLLRIARCESGGRWKISTGNGFYGGLQFTIGSWRAVGGTGYPHWRSRLEQMYRAVKLMRIQGWGAWPVCQHA